MFQAIISRAQTAIDDTLALVASRALMAVPFIVAVAFGVAALYLRLAREYGAETASLVMAALWLLVGLLVAAVLAMRAAEPSDSAGEELRAETPATDAATSSNASFSNTERDLLLAGLTSAAPIALPQLLRMIMRNLPLIAAIAVAIFVMTRPSATNEEQENAAAPMPAE